jgi:hypothetical protein
LRAARADQSVRGDRFDATLPDGFRPTAGTFAREAAAPLRDLLTALGAEAMGARRVRYDVLGSPTEPEAAFVARCFVMRPPEKDVLGRISDEKLAAGWAWYTAGHKGHVAVAPRRRTVCGLPSHELGGSEPVPGGGVRWMRFLLVHRADEVLILGLTATGPETARWDAAWERLVDGLRIETPAPRSGLLQGITLGTAIGTLLTAGMLRLLARRRARRASRAEPLSGWPGAPPPGRVAGADRPGPASLPRARAATRQAPAQAPAPRSAPISPTVRGDEPDARDVAPTELERALARRIAESNALGTTRLTAASAPD